MQRNYMGYRITVDRNRWSGRYWAKWELIGNEENESCTCSDFASTERDALVYAMMQIDRIVTNK
jgi:hypothetical protein